MNLLEVFFIVSGLLIFFLALDIARKKKFNALHFVVFLIIGIALLVFTAFPKILNIVGNFVGLQRGADLLVYTSIIFLIYFVLLLLRKVESNNENLTELIREMSVKNGVRKKIEGKELFIIPSFNEGEVIVSTIQAIFDAGYTNVLLVNDGSNDNTNTLIKKAFGEKVILLEHHKNRGQGAALETGFEYARRYANVDYVITFDADGQHSIDDVKIFEQYLNDNEGIEILLGSRFLSEKQQGIPVTRKIILRLGILFTFVLSNIKLTDTHNGFRLITKAALPKLKLTIDGMGHASEILDLIAENKLFFKEVPVNIIYTDYSLNKGQSSMNAIKIARKVIWNKFFK